MAKDVRPGGSGTQDELKKTRRKIQTAIEQAEEEHRRRLLEQRIELANAGIKAFQRKDHAEAVRAFLTYIRILEDWKGVSEGGLNPGLFDRKKDLPELLLIAGVYWDLTKLYDRTKSADRRKLFLHYMEKFIAFSRAMPYQAVSAESLRKYINSDKALHKEDFKNAHKMLAPSRCFVATALREELDPETLLVLRRFRDERLKKRRLGRAFVKGYYSYGPRIAEQVERAPRWVRVVLARSLELFF